jgi:hypothetical protein
MWGGGHIAEKMKEARLRWYRHVTRRDEGEHGMKRSEDVEWYCGRHCKEGEGSKTEMIWTRNKKR